MTKFQEGRSNGSQTDPDRLMARRKGACRWLLILAVGLLPLTMNAGQSLVLRTGQPVLKLNDPGLSFAQSWRLEFQLHDFTAAPPDQFGYKFFYLSGVGLVGTIYPDGSLNLADLWDLGDGGAPCQVPTAGLTNVLVRVQRDTASKRFTCELWNFDGTAYKSHILPFGVSRNYVPGAGGGDIGLGANVDLGFLRIALTVLPLGSKPPTTADGGDWTELKFDGSLRDSSGHNHNVSGSGASYATTPNQTAFAVAKTYGAPPWSNWVSLRAGYSARLDSTASYSLADGSSAVSSYWQQTKGPTQVIWADRTSATPSISGLIFGTYTFSVRVTDANGTATTSTLDVGAVATDDNGVVINADPNVDKLFGPMIAFGKNPWGFADERAITATRLRSAAYKAQGWNPPSWEQALEGTVSYIYAGGTGPLVTTLTADIADASSTTISVADASKIDLSTLPTRILIGPGYRGREDVRICAASASRGPATLTVCYDGRGQANPQGESYRVKAQSWPAGTQVWQMRVQGSGTNFLSQLCPAGAGPGGPIVYSSGSVTLSPGTANAAGTGTSWSQANGIYPNNVGMRVSATRSGGTPYVFYAYVSQIVDPAHLVLSRPYPADADAGTFSYSIIQADNRFATLHYARSADGSDAQTYYGIAGCESETELYVINGTDLLGLSTNGPQNGKQYSYMDGLGYAGGFGANFYGEDLAHRALYYRSGWDFALQTARAIGDYFVRSPVVAGGDVGGLPLRLGGGVIGGFASAILDGSHPGHATWPDLRGFATRGSIGSLDCNTFDTRDSSYLSSWLALAAGFDPDPGQRSVWMAGLNSIYDRENRCRRSDNSWAHGALWDRQFGPLTLTNGSDTVTGTNLPPAMCYGIASGKVEVTKNSAIAIPADGSFVAGNKIVINATSDGQPYVSFFEFHINPDGTATLGALWPGDSGTFSYVVENNDGKMTIGTSNNDAQLTREWACTWNNPGQVTLNRPWDGPSESNAYAWEGLLAGYGQQPFMMGIKTTELKFASLVADATVSSNFAALASQAAGWVHDVGYDPVSNGLHYGRIYQACEPQTTPPAGSAFASRTPICDSGFDPGSVRAARVLAAEANSALRVQYESNPTPESKKWGDLVYGSIWGNPNYTADNVYSDANFVRDEDSDGSLGGYKWTGFFFGMGMAHQWPAVRLGGLAAPKMRTVYMSLNRGSADSARIVVTAPSGLVTTFGCGTAQACPIQVDDRQGGHWFQIQYLSGDQVVSQSEPDLLVVPPALQ